MKHPQTPEMLKTEILKASDNWLGGSDQYFGQLLKILPEVPGQVIAEGVFLVFEESERPDQMYTDQKLSGIILQQLTPAYDGDPLVLLNRLIKSWNKSVPGLPEWFMDNYGEEKLTMALKGFDHIDCTEDVSENFNTFKWWLRL
jgi:hypothetical protein